VTLVVAAATQYTVDLDSILVARKRRCQIVNVGATVRIDAFYGMVDSFLLHKPEKGRIRDRLSIVMGREIFNQERHQPAECGGEQED